MKAAVLAVCLALGASAAPSIDPTRPQCCFGINAYGVQGTVSDGYWGKVQQLSDGQLRIGQWNIKSESKFCLNRNFGLFDQNHFGCILAGREEQFQCDFGKMSSFGWHIGFEGIVTLQGSASFWACPTGDHGGFNIYKKALPGPEGYCSQITLVADGCRAAHPPQGKCNGPKCSRPSCSGPSCHLPECNGPSCPRPIPIPQGPKVPRPLPAPPSHSGGWSFSASKNETSVITASCHSPPCAPPKPARPVCSRPGCDNRHARCPGELGGHWEFPHLIIPVDSRRPDFAPGTSFFGTVSKSTRSYFNFDIPAEYSGKTCTVRFLFPQHSQLETSNFELKGSGEVFAGWTREVSKTTSYETAPQCSKKTARVLKPGNSYVLGKAECRPGVMGFAMQGASDTHLKWFQDFNPCPIGLYLTAE